MCGIFGFIGESKDPKTTYDLLDKLFKKTEIRGTDASGFYVIEKANGSIMYDKEPKKSTEYCKQDVWTKDVPTIINAGCDLFIGHCRQTSVGGGPERINKNNHPHVSDDRRVAMVHNGKIPEFSALKSKYSIESDCDSEILLRMFESAQVIAKEREAQLKEDFPKLTPFLAERLLGLKEIFSRVNYGAMAVAIAERGDDGSRYLWLFRDEERPLHVIDMRKTLGQIFFCSTAEIWRQVVEDTPSAKEFIAQDQVIIEFPAYQTWLLSIDEKEESPSKPWHIRKFKITKTKYIDWKQEEDEDDKLNFKKPSGDRLKPPMEVKCRLGKEEAIIAEKTLKEEPSAPPTADEKKKRNSGRSVVGGNGGSFAAGGTTGPVVPVAAKVEVPKSREPGDETYDLAPDELSNGEIITAGDVIKNPIQEIDLGLFETNLDEVVGELNKLRDKMFDQARENSLSARNYSTVLDQLEVIRQIGGQSFGSV